MIYHANSNEMNAGLVILSDKVHSKVRDTKKWIHQEDIMNLNVHILNNIVLSYMKQTKKT